MSANLNITDTKLDGLKVVVGKRIEDSRGFLERLFSDSELATVLGSRTIAQVNHTKTAKAGTVRGMHFQNPPHAEMKFVMCLRGEVFDVAVDLRAQSPTMLQWHGEVLSDAAPRIMVIPEGFAHGFQTLTDDCEMLYFHTARYQQQFEGGVSPEDPRIGIRWPQPVGGLSARDSAHPLITRDFRGIAL